MATKRSYRGAFLAVAAVATIVTAAVVYRRVKSKKRSKPRPKPSPKGGKPDEQLVKLFESAAAQSKELQGISNTEKLILYALYKQSMEGDAPESAPRMTLNIVEGAKYRAWDRVRGMSATQAMIHYTDAVQKLRIHGSVDKGGLDGIEAMDEMDDIPIAGGTFSSLANRAEDDGDGYQGKDLTTAEKLLRAASQNNVKEVKSILAKKPELIEHRDEDGQSALHLAADKGAADALSVLMESGADGNAADGDGITVLHAAVIAENVEACRVLLKHGANPDQPDVDGDTPRKCAQEDGSTEMKELFASYKKT